MTKKIKIRTKLKIDDENAPTTMKINTLVSIDDIDSKKKDYYLIIDNGEQIKGDYSQIIELHKMFKNSVIIENIKDKPIKLNDNNKIDTQKKIFELFKDQFYSELST